MSEDKFVDIRGLLDSYEFPCTLPGSGRTLLIKPITTGQMKKILVYEDETDPHVIEQALDKLISGCVVSDNFDIDDLYLQDRFYLLLEIRKVSKGSSYNFGFKCPKCKFENIRNFSLDDLTNRPMGDSDGMIKINDKMKFKVDFPTRKDQKDAFEKYPVNKKMSDKEREVEIITATFSNCIKEIHTKDGIVSDVPIDDKMYVLDNIPSDVFDSFKQWFVDNGFGIEFKIPVTCGGCDFEKTMDIPLSDFFI